MRSAEMDGVKARDAVALGRALAEGTVSARAVAEACLEVIAERDGEVRAFAHVAPDYVRAQADALDAHRAAGAPLGPLHGLPVAVKDIIDTADYPTENGTALDKGRRPRTDAVVVARARAAGAVILGKTVTAELAYKTPGATRNPHDLSRTPGGSSQGSAAAVAAGMVPLALGTQTVGSVIRPASFCGVVGVKPTHGRLPLTGVLTGSGPLDTVGVLAGSVADAALLLGVCEGYEPTDPFMRPFAPEDLLASARAEAATAPRFAIVGGPFWSEVSADVVALFDELAGFLGARADRVALPEVFAKAYPAHIELMEALFARNLRHYRERGDAALSQDMRDALDRGAAVTAAQYLAALDWQSALSGGLAPIFERYDAILTPAALGEAPASLATTGDSRANALWTFLGVPAVTIPVGKGAAGMPIGVQLVGRHGEDGRLLRTAVWLEKALADAGA